MIIGSGFIVYGTIGTYRFPSRSQSDKAYNFAATPLSRIRTSPTSHQQCIVMLLPHSDSNFMEDEETAGGDDTKTELWPVCAVLG